MEIKWAQIESAIGWRKTRRHASVPPDVGLCQNEGDINGFMWVPAARPYHEAEAPLCLIVMRLPPHRPALWEGSENNLLTD